MSVDKFKGINNDISKATFDEILEDNIISYIDWSFINAGAYQNVSVASSGAYGGNFSLLQPLDDPRVEENTVYRTARKPLVWESGVERGSPIAISGVYINGSFTSDVTVDYRNGLFIFNDPVSGKVEAEYSFKSINVISADNIPWLRTSNRSYRVDGDNFVSGSGNRYNLPEVEIQLPAVAVEVTDTDRIEGYQLGGSQTVVKNITLYVIAEDAPTAKRISSILEQQSRSTLFVYDTNYIIENDDFPLNYDGTLSDSPKTYPQLIKPSGEGGYRSKEIANGKVFIEYTKKENQQRLTDSLVQTPVTWRVNAILTKI